MAFDARLCLTKLGGNKNIFSVCHMLKSTRKRQEHILYCRHLHLSCYKYMYSKSYQHRVLDKLAKGGFSRGGFSNESSIPWKSSTNILSAGFHEEKKKGIYPSNDDMNLRHSVENDYLSWMRNTYLMTIIGLTILNTTSIPENMVITKVVFIMAFLNLTGGTLGYVHSLSSLRKRAAMKKFSSFSCQTGALFHWFLWSSILLLIISPEENDNSNESRHDVTDTEKK